MHPRELALEDLRAVEEISSFELAAMRRAHEYAKRHAACACRSIRGRCPRGTDGCQAYQEDTKHHFSRTTCVNVNVNVITTDATTGATALLLNVCLCDFYIVTRRPTRKLLRDVNMTGARRRRATTVSPRTMNPTQSNKEYSN